MKTLSFWYTQRWQTTGMCLFAEDVSPIARHPTTTAPWSVHKMDTQGHPNTQPFLWERHLKAHTYLNVIHHQASRHHTKTCQEVYTNDLWSNGEGRFWNEAIAWSDELTGESPQFLSMEAQFQFQLSEDHDWKPLTHTQDAGGPNGNPGIEEAALTQPHIPESKAVER